MSGPVPSPSMNGMIGSSGTTSRSFCRVMAVPVFGGVSDVKFGIDPFRSDYRPPNTGFPQRLWKTLWKRSVVYTAVRHQPECFSTLHHGRALAPHGPNRDDQNRRIIL